MTIIEEGKKIRVEVAKLRKDRRRRYPPGLRRRILDWVERAMAGGMRRCECGDRLGIKSWRLKSWQQGDAGAELDADAETLALVPIEAAPLALASIETPLVAPPSGATLVTPTGYRVEGLAVEQIAALLRELA